MIISATIDSFSSTNLEFAFFMSLKIDSCELNAYSRILDKSVFSLYRKIFIPAKKPIKKNAKLQKSMRVRSLYKYNSISNVPQKIILKMLTSIEGNRSLSEYCELTKSHISKNIQYLKERNFLFSEYPSDPIGPFAIVNINFDELLLNKISSVPLKKFSLDKTISNDYSRISLAVNSDLFKKYFDLIN